MKRIFVLLAIVIFSFSAKAGSLQIINNTPFTFTNWTAGVGGPGLPPTLSFHGPTFSIGAYYSGYFSNVEDFILLLTGSPSGYSLYGPSYSINHLRAGVSSVCSYGFLVLFGGAPYAGCAYNVSYTASGTNGVLTINP